MGRMRVLGMAGLFALSFAGQARAFCGTYVGGAGAAVYNHASEILLAREGDKTTLTLKNDFEGELTDFALLIPVPEILDAEDVRAVDLAVFDTVDAYGSPRVVAYTCEDVVSMFHLEDPTQNVGGGCASYAMMGDKSGDSAGGYLEDETHYGVDVEALFDVVEYEIAILSAEGGDGLVGWLDANGYEIPAGGKDLFQEYIEAGSYFLAAKVNTENLVEGQTWLSPLQFTYHTQSFGLPIRLGTISSSGEQDLILHVVTEVGEGEVGVSNYPGFAIEDECMWPSEEPNADFVQYYEDQVAPVFEAGPRAQWTVEYSWAQTPTSWTGPGNANTSYHCDPCNPDPRDPTGTTPALLNLAQMGFGLDYVAPDTETLDTATVDTGGAAYQAKAGHYTRIHMRYTPGQVDQDLMLYGTGRTDNHQIRFLTYEHDLESYFPVCGKGYVEDPGACADAELAPMQDSTSCALAPTPRKAIVVVLGLVFLALRRRSARA